MKKKENANLLISDLLLSRTLADWPNQWPPLDRRPSLGVSPRRSAAAPSTRRTIAPVPVPCSDRLSSVCVSANWHERPAPRRPTRSFAESALSTCAGSHWKRSSCRRQLNCRRWSWLMGPSRPTRRRWSKLHFLLETFSHDLRAYFCDGATWCNSKGGHSSFYIDISKPAYSTQNGGGLMGPERRSLNLDKYAKQQQHQQHTHHSRRAGTASPFESARIYRWMTNPSRARDTNALGGEAFRVRIDSIYKHLCAINRIPIRILYWVSSRPAI